MKTKNALTDKNSTFDPLEIKRRSTTRKFIKNAVLIGVLGALAVIALTEISEATEESNSETSLLQTEGFSEEKLNLTVLGPEEPKQEGLDLLTGGSNVPFSVQRISMTKPIVTSEMPISVFTEKISVQPDNNSSYKSIDYKISSDEISISSVYSPLDESSSVTNRGEAYPGNVLTPLESIDWFSSGEPKSGTRRNFYSDKPDSLSLDNTRASSGDEKSYSESGTGYLEDDFEPAKAIGSDISTQPISVTDHSESHPSNICSTSQERKIEKSPPLGPLYDIAEPDLLQLFMKRLRTMKENGQYDERFNANKALIGDLLENPPAVQGLRKSLQERSWLLTASIPESLPEELLRQAQEIELPKITRELLFIDGTDPDSIESAGFLAQRLPDMRVVLTAGSPAEVSKLLNRRIFFDQGGGLVRVFGIEAVPAILFNSVNGPAGLEFPVTETEQIAERFFPTNGVEGK